MEDMAITHNGFWKNKRVLITGHTGFKGSWLTLLLLKLGAEVWGYSLEADKNLSFFENLNLNDEKNNPFFSCFNHQIGDINNFNKLSKFTLNCNPDIVFHLAAQPLVLESYKDPINTWNTNVIGTIKLLESLKCLKKKLSIVVVTTDKVYLNKKSDYCYRETDQLGGYDPYSASKAAVEIAVSSWRSSFCNQNKNLISIATARAGNVIGGGDWSKNRLVPDAIRSLISKSAIPLRNPNFIRPWQYVLDPLRGYIILAEKLYSAPEKLKQDNKFAREFNFGPSNDLEKSVLNLVQEILINWEGDFYITKNENAQYESSRLTLSSELSMKLLGWESIISFSSGVRNTVNWYKSFYRKENCLEFSIKEIDHFLNIVDKYSNKVF